MDVSIALRPEKTAAWLRQRSSRRAARKAAKDASGTGKRRNSAFQVSNPMAVLAAARKAGDGAEDKGACCCCSVLGWVARA